MLRGWDTLDPRAQERLQIALLQRFLREQVLPFHPYYRELFEKEKLRPEQFRSLADLARIPMSSKSDVAPSTADPERPRRFVLTPTPATLRANLSLSRKLSLLWPRLRHGQAEVQRLLGLEYRPVQVFFTTGRTALPTSFLLTRYDLEILERVGARIGEVVGIDASRDRVVSVFPYAPHLAFWQVQAVSVASGCFALQTGGGKVMGTSGIIKAIERVRPSFICGIPGYVYHMLREGVEGGLDLSNVRTVFLGGDRIMPGARDKLRELLRGAGAKDPRVISVFGFTESKKCWSECVQGGNETGLHTYPDLEIFEVIDPKTGRILPDGESGELVYTNLDGRGSIVLRYRTGDIAQGGMTRAVCPACGRSVPRLSSDLSRASNMADLNLTKIKGALVNLTLVADLLNGHPQVEEWQLVIRKKNDDPFEVDEVSLLLALAGGAPRESTLADLKTKFMAMFELHVAIEVHSRQELLERIGMESRLKENRIVDQRPKSGASPAPVSTADQTALRH